MSDEPLDRVAVALGPVRGDAALRFFNSTTDLLGQLTPEEVMLGRVGNERALDDDARRLLGAPLEERTEAVVKAAIAYAAQLSG
jgi:hypothetical protein